MDSRDPDQTVQNDSEGDRPGPQAAKRRPGSGARTPNVVLGVSGALILCLIAVAALVNVFRDDAGDAPPLDVTAEVALETAVQDRPETAATLVPTAPSTMVEQPDAPSTPVAGEATETVAETEPARSSVASSCSERCLVRVPADDNLAGTLAKANTRASWTSESWVWTVAAPEGIATLEANGEATLVTESAETLRLYVVVMPDGEDDETLVEQFGTIIDSIDRYRLVKVKTVPAIVTSLTDNGYNVEKLMPAPPTTIDVPEESIALSDIDIGSLIEDVSTENLESTIADLQATSSTDGTGVGTRYYSTTGNAIAAEYLVQRLEGYGLRVWYEDFLTPEGHLLVNVVGEVAGRDEGAIYGVMAHYDTMSTDPTNSPGADDNATGIASSLEIARILSGYELKHPVRVMFVTAEEVGIIGSDQFAREAAAREDPYEGIFNIDSIGSDRQGQLLVLNADGSSMWMEDLIVRINDSYGLGQEMLVRQNSAIVADDNKLRDQGLEAVMVARELYGWSPLHHTPDDLIENVSIPNTVSATTLILLSIATLVQG